jgi:hypothetical protein
LFDTTGRGQSVCIWSCFRASRQDPQADGRVEVEHGLAMADDRIAVGLRHFGGVVEVALVVVR